MHWTRCAVTGLALLALAGCAPASRREERAQGSRKRALTELETLRSEADGAVGIPFLGRDQVGPRGRTIPTTRPRPDWVATGRALRYPEPRYLISIGSERSVNGNDYRVLAAAEDRARAEIAQALRLRAAAEFQSAAALMADGERDQAADRIRSQAGLMLEGVYIADRWYDSEARTFWALAALDRALTGQLLQDRMAKLRRELDRDREIGGMFARGGHEFQAAGYLNRARSAALTLLNYRAQLRVASPVQTEGPPDLDADFRPLWREAASAMDSLHVAVAIFPSIEEDAVDAPAAEEHILKCMKDAGVRAIRLAPRPGDTYDRVRTRAFDDLAQWAGPETDCLILVDLAARQVASRKRVAFLMNYCQASGAAVALDMDARRLVASIEFDRLPESYTSNRRISQACQDALLIAARHLAQRLRRNLGGDLGLSRELCGE